MGNSSPYLTFPPKGERIAAEIPLSNFPPKGERIAAEIPLSNFPPKGERIAANGLFETYNLGVGRGVSVLEMIGVSRAVTGKDIDYYVVGRRDGDLAEVYCNAEKAKKELDWEARVSLEDSIKNSWRFYKN